MKTSSTTVAQKTSFSRLSFLFSIVLALTSSNLNHLLFKNHTRGVIPVVAASSSSVYSSSSTSSNNNKNAERYASLPPTVFSPDGRLYNVEKTAQLSSEERDLSSSLVMALKFGSNKKSSNNNNGKEKVEEEECEYVLILATRPMSPHLYHHQNPKMKTKPKQEKEESSSKKKALWTNNGTPFQYKFQSHPSSSSQQVFNTLVSQPTVPLAMVSGNILIGTGGNAIDSLILNRKIRELALALHRANDGIVRDGNYDTNNDGNNNKEQFEKEEDVVVMNKRFSSSSLARKVADMVQGPTQTMSGSNGKMLASAAIIVGGNEQNNLSSLNTNFPKHTIWRIDATGQFWDCHAAAVGRGAGSAEATVLTQAAKYWNKKRMTKSVNEGGMVSSSSSTLQMTQQQQSKMGEPDEDLQRWVHSLSQKDVRQYLQSLSFDDAMILVCSSVVKALKLNINNKDSPSIHHDNNGDQLSSLWNQLGLRGFLIPRRRSNQAVYPEMIDSRILKGALRIALQQS